MSEKIVEAVKQAIERNIGEDGFIAQDGYYVKVDALLNLDVIARAAIEAYEAEKTRDLLAVPGTYAYLPNDDMMHKSPIEEARGNPSFHNKWLNEAMDRLAGCKK